MQKGPRHGIEHVSNTGIHGKGGVSSCRLREVLGTAGRFIRIPSFVFRDVCRCMSYYNTCGGCGALHTCGYSYYREAVLRKAAVCSLEHTWRAGGEESLDSIFWHVKKFQFVLSFAGVSMTVP